MYRRQPSEVKEQIRRIELETDALVTDFAYNYNGSKLAVADSRGNVFIFQRVQQSFLPISKFEAHDAAIWKICWSDPLFGSLLAVASFKKKVGVFQEQKSKWTQIAKHQLHEGSVNFVEWAPSYYGVKLYSAASDGTVGILEVRNNSWVATTFHAHDSSVTCLSIKPIPLNQEFVKVHENLYPTIATIGKDLHLKIWRHSSESKQLNLSAQEGKDQNSYKKISDSVTHKESTRTILFRPIWDGGQPQNYEIISGSEDGIVKVLTFENDTLARECQVFSGSSAVVKLSQNSTGSIVSISCSSNKEQKTVLCQQTELSQWQILPEK